MSLYLVRHGATLEDSEDDPKFSGPGDIGLSDAGKAQMVDAAGWLAQHASITWLLTSPIARAKESAEILGEKLDIEPKIFSAARDWHNGAVAGHSVAKILPFVEFFERNPDLPIPGGEPYKDYWERHTKGFEYLQAQPYEQLDIAVSTHSRWIAVCSMKIDGAKHSVPTDFTRTPKPGGIMKVSRSVSGALQIELVHGEMCEK